VVAGPGDEMPAGVTGHGRMRASHTDREQVIDALKDAFVHGRLTGDELDARTGISLPAAGQHASVLRNAGLITTRRQGSAVLHVLTPLGAELVRAG